jgi:hypothetical protein
MLLANHMVYQLCESIQPHVANRAPLWTITGVFLGLIWHSGHHRVIQVPNGHTGQTRQCCQGIICPSCWATRLTHQRIHAVYVNIVLLLVGWWLTTSASLVGSRALLDITGHWSMGMVSVVWQQVSLMKVSWWWGAPETGVHSYPLS